MAVASHSFSAAAATPKGAAPSSLVKEAGRDAELVAFERELVAFFVDAADVLGVPKSVAAIYGVCFAACEPLSFADIEARLAISAGSISQGLRVLREVGALKTTTTAAPPAGAGRDAKRREYYEPDLHLRKLTAHWLENRLQRQLDAGKDRLKAIAKTVPAGRLGAHKVLRERVKTLQGWHGQASAVMPLVKTFLKLG